ncbi:MAG: AmmeMemoRadiSam system radical SAM enzyme [Candidatus Altiarchaeota archaeon]
MKKIKRRNSTSFFKQKITRRDFLKKGVVGLFGIAAGYFILKKLFLEKLPVENSVGSQIQELWKWSKEASYYEKFPSYIRCKLCPHQCSLNENERGICRARVNFRGKLYTLTYGNPCALHIDPIEKKPFYHFLPGTFAFSLSTAGCNLRCKYCQNFDISQKKPEETTNYDMLPEKTVELALNEKGKDDKVMTIAYTYAEPVAFYDYMLDTAKIANEKGIRNVVVTAGYINEKPLINLAKEVDAIKIDLKGFNERFYREICEAELEHVLKACKITYREAKWFEIVNLVVPTLNDNLEEIKQLCEWIKENLSKDIPLHFSRFHPMYKLTNLPPTPIETLKKARDIALNVGLNFVYIGNVPHDDYENTYCPKCKSLLIERIGYKIKRNDIIDGKCKNCGAKIPGIWN